MPDQDQQALIAEAADIFVRLREDPGNAALVARRDAFRQRGRREREIYARVARAWEGAGRRPGPGRLMIAAAVSVLATAAYFLTDPLREALLADAATGLTPARIELASGDIAMLDADSALIDRTTGEDRHLTLLEGTAIFDVQTDGRRFTVEAGALGVEVLGTVFEVARADGDIWVSVGEGSVRVTAQGHDWTLGAGDRLAWSEDEGARLSAVTPDGFGLWRQDRLVADGMSFAQVAEIIDRRLPGHVVIPGGALARSRVSGVLDLAQPELALEALAAARGARVVTVPVLGRLILR